jgi:ACS family tartrate transporter-like MFS transporter
VVLGVVTLFVFTDRPWDAKWLTAEEREYLEGTLAAEAAAKESVERLSIGGALRLPAVWCLALGIFATNTGGYALGFWLPTTVKSLSAGSDRAALFYSGLFFLLGVVGVLYAGFSSDRTGDRKWHCVAGQALTGVFLAASSIPGQPFWLVMAWLCLTGLTAYSWPPPFWALPTMTLTASAAATAVGMINMFANLAGYFGNHIFGWIKDRGATDGQGLLFLAACYLVGAGITAMTPLRRERRADRSG